MVSNTFKFVGNIVPCKETEKFHPYETAKFPNSDWGKKSIKFNMVCGNNRHLVESSALFNIVAPNQMKIYTYSKGSINADGTRVKGEKLQINFNDRHKTDVIANVAEYKKFIVDTEMPFRRKKLEAAIDKFKESTVTDDIMEELGVHSLEECEKAYEESNSKRHEFISEYDFVDYLNLFVNNEEFKKMKFKVIGNYDLEYDAKNDKWYRHLNVHKIYRQPDDAEIISHVTFGVVFGRECIDKSDFDETKKAHANIYISQYIQKFHAPFFSPLRLTIDGNGDDKSYKKACGFMKILDFPDTCDCDYREVGLVCKLLNGAQEVELTEDMLTDEQRENIEFGLTTLEDIKRELGKPVYGDRVTDIVIEKLVKGYSKGAQDTAFSEKDFGKPYDKDIVNDDLDDEDNIFDEDIDI